MVKKAKKGFKIKKNKSPLTGETVYTPIRTKTKRPIQVAMGEPAEFPTKQQARNWTHKLKR